MHVRAMAAVWACAGGLAAAANAQVVQFRIVELDGQTWVSSAADAVLNLAVQARVLGGPALGGFDFNIKTGDAESNGTLLRLRIQNADQTYYTGAHTPSGTGGTKVGMAFQYFYLAGIGASFNGLINLSGGNFTNNPAENEIGLIAGAATGGSMLSTPGLDPSAEGNPATWSGYGASATPPNNATAPLDPAIGAPYFAQGQFIDIYRFRYTVTNFADRNLHFSLDDVGAQVFNEWLYNNGAWGAANTTLGAAQVESQSLSIGVGIFPAPGTALLVAGAAMYVGARRRRAERLL